MAYSSINFRQKISNKQISVSAFKINVVKIKKKNIYSEYSHDGLNLKFKFWRANIL